MLNNGAFKTVVVPNPEVLEYEAWATMGITINDQFSHKVMKTLTEHPAVYLASYSIGRFNLIIAARFRSIDLLDRFVNMELPAIAGVGSVETFLHVRPLKYHNINWYPLTSSDVLNHQQGSSLRIELDRHSEDLDKSQLKGLKYG
jgi:DNA-binding Lrp family transcriptional regulator